MLLCHVLGCCVGTHQGVHRCDGEDYGAYNVYGPACCGDVPTQVGASEDQSLHVQRSGREGV